MENLTYNDLTILTAALDAWTSRSFGKELMETMMDSMFSGKISEEMKIKRADEKKRKRMIDAEKQEHEKEIATLLKAKLITMKQAIATEGLIDMRYLAGYSD